MSTSFSFGDNNNRVIKASAGSGKTFQLAMRYLALLFADPELKPEQIAAITFTRKAAGEIFDKILDQLLKMHEEPSLLAGYIRQGLLPAEFSAGAIPCLLKRLLLSRELQISTIDSFCVRIIQAFSPEFGISGPVEMVDGKRDPGARETLRKVIRKEQETLLPLLKEYGEEREARSVMGKLKDFFEQNYSFFLLYPEEAMWGNFPEEKDALTEAERIKICDTLKAGVEFYNYPTGVRNRFSELLDAVENDEPRLIKSQLRMEKTPEGFRIRFGNKKGGYPLSCEMYEGLRKLYHFAAVSDCRKKKAKTKAAYRLLKLFDDLYSADIREQGRLTFRDLPKLLSSLPEDKKLDLEYRLDTRNRHYMLDEFQDTSDQQWKFLNNLLSEAIQGTDQSFFMVGDVKQSLYQWRYGNPKLFDSICREYSLEPLHSDRSFRSAPAVIECLNAVFCHPEKQQEREAKAIARMGFQRHETAQNSLSGYAALIQFPEDEERNQYTEVHHCLQKITPLERSLSVAILVRTNREVENWKQALRALDSRLPVSTEGVVKPAESMACSLLFLLIRAAVHPGNRMVRGALPLFCLCGKTRTAAEYAALLQLPETESWPGLSARLRSVLEEEGIPGIVRRFQLAFSGELSAFDRERLAVAAAEAEDFSGTADEYLALMETAGGNENSVSKTLQIMTIHRSKGLEFDVVILPELGTLRTPNNAQLTVEPMPENCNQFSPSWIGYLPGDTSRQNLPALQAVSGQIEDDNIYEKCCSLYVAMTRARRGLYLFVKTPPGNEGKTFRADLLLRKALQAEGEDSEILFETGTADWYLEALPPPGTQEKTPLPLETLRVKPLGEQQWLSPSETPEEEGNEELAGKPWRMRFESPFSARLGTRLHTMMESVDFLDSVEQEKIRALCGEDEITSEAWKLWQNLMASPEIRKALTRPATPFQLWRERNFLLKNAAGIPVSGCFDRVLIYLDPAGRPQRAVISDYKSDALTGEEDFLERHSRQLTVYRKALAQMLELPEEKIACEIIALRPGKVIPLP